MSDPKRKKGAAETVAEIDARLNGLLGTLGSSLAEALERLEEAGSAEVHRAQSIATPKGPLRAEAGVRVRFAGQDQSARSTPRPVNRDSEGRRAPPQTNDQPAPPQSGDESTAPKPPPRQPDLVSFTDTGTWHLCADLPGVAQEDLSVSIDEACTPASLVVRTDGQRQYAATHPLPETVDLSSMTYELRNGVLEVILKTRDASDAQT